MGVLHTNNSVIASEGEVKLNNSQHFRYIQLEISLI
jgi:hypothetical protein